MGITVVRDSKRLFERKMRNRFDGDLNREIAELITNSIDSYNRLIKKGLLDATAERHVLVKLGKPIRKKKEQHTIIVIDNAEGMSCNELKNIFSERGDDNNGGSENEQIRGLFGLGASDCMNASLIEGKSAEYWSFKNNEVTNLRFQLSEDKNVVNIIDTIIKDEKQIKSLREKFSINNNGTVAIFGVPDSVNFEKDFKDLQAFKHSLETIFVLRNLLNDDKNIVELEAFGDKTRLSSKEYTLSNPILVKENITFEYRKVQFSGRIEFYKNDDKTRNPTHILVEDDRGNVYDNQMFDFAKTQGNENLSGIFVINNFWERLNDFLSKNIDLIKDDRSGIDTNKKFGKTIVAALAPSIKEALAIIVKEKGTHNISLQKTKGYADFLKFLNKDLNSTPSSIGGGSVKGKEPPAGGLEFARANISITATHAYDLKLYINTLMIKPGDIIEINALGNNGNIETIETIELKETDIGENNLLIKSCAIKAINKTDIPIELFAKCNDCSAKCNVTVIEEDIIYPANGIEFEKHEITLAPDVNHKKIRLYFDKSVITDEDEILVTNDSNGRFVCSSSKLKIGNGKMITDTIGYLNLDFSGGDLKDKYTVIAACGARNDKLNVIIDASKYPENGFSGDISDYDIDPNKYYLELKSYYDLLTKKVYIVQGNATNDTFISEYTEKLTGKSLLYVISLVCNEAAKLYANKEVANGHISKADFEGYTKIIDNKQDEYFKQYLKISQGNTQR